MITGNNIDNWLMFFLTILPNDSIWIDKIEQLLEARNKKFKGVKHIDTKVFDNDLD